MAVEALTNPPAASQAIGRDITDTPVRNEVGSSVGAYAQVA
jgi:hypothetical protein